MARTDISGFVQLATKLRNVANDAPQALINTVDTLGYDWQLAAMQGTPVDTGNAKRSYSYEIENGKTIHKLHLDNDAVNEYGTNYVPFIDLGHRIVTRNGDTVGYFQGIGFVDAGFKRANRKFFRNYNKNLRLGRHI